MKFSTVLISILSIQTISCVAKENTGNANPSTIAKATGFMQSSKWAFEENKGQVTGEDASRVKFLHKAGNLSMFLLDNGIAYQFNSTHYPEGYKVLGKLATPEERARMDALAKEIRIETYRMDVTLIGANPKATITTEGKSADYIQYYNHNALDVRSYSKVSYHNIYPNIDWVIYQRDGNIKYDFVVHPGGNPSQIRLQTKWVEELKLDSEGSLTIGNRMGSITEQTPVSFQNGKEIATAFVIKDGVLSFSLADYDKSSTLAIDPSLLWATYYGGNDFESGTSCATDVSGNVYLAGNTQSTTNIAAGGHQTIAGGLLDAYLVKFTSAGTRLWATYYGGSKDDRAVSCATDTLGNVYLSGSTSSTNNIAFNGHQNTYGGGQYSDVFLVKFNGAGIRQWATYYGGNGNEDIGSCTIDKWENIYMTGTTSSSNNIATGGFQNSFKGMVDAFLVKFNNTGVRRWGTYYGDTAHEAGVTCATDAQGNVYLAGSTTSPSNMSFNGHQNNYNGNFDAYLVKFDSVGTRQWATYYGGNNSDGALGCATDALGNIYLTGGTESSTDITSAGHQTTLAGSNDGFLVKFNNAGVRQWATYYGGSNLDLGYSCNVDTSGNVFLVGYTASATNISSSGYQNTLGGATDAFLVMFNDNGVRQWATYYGGSNIDEGISCIVDPAGDVYLVGLTSSAANISFNGHQNSYGDGGQDAMLVKFDPNGPNDIENVKEQKFKVYPNPANDILYVDGVEEIELQVYSITGKLMDMITARQTHAIDISAYTPGLYFIKARSGIFRFIKL